MTTDALVTFTLDEQRFALPCMGIRQIIPMVEITQIPDAPQDTLGIINLHGQIIPVLNIRARLNLPEKSYDVLDSLLIAQPDGQAFAFIVADPSFLSLANVQSVRVENPIQGATQVNGIIKDEEGLIKLLDMHQLYQTRHENTET